VPTWKDINGCPLQTVHSLIAVKRGGQIDEKPLDITTWKCDRRLFVAEMVVWSYRCTPLFSDFQFSAGGILLTGLLTWTILSMDYYSPVHACRGDSFGLLLSFVLWVSLRN
jgi:hypothetical protein